MTTGQLGEFLRARRGRLHPEDVGLSRYGERRRVEGLRREEVAQLAGVSVSYYTRLEQGQSANASAAILEALARALQLDVHEQTHLRELASRRVQPPRRPPVEHVSALTRDLLRSLDHLPVLVLGRRTDVLAWNELGHALLAGHVDFTSVDNPATRPNLARLLFLDSHSRDLYVDWHRKVRTVVGSLRLAAGRHPDDALLSALIGELSVKSEEFVSLWADHRVKPCEADSYDLRHPLAGPLTVTMQNLTLARDAEQSLVVVTTAEGSSSADALQLLARESRGKNIQDPMTAERA
ncbi:helix-turn-helix transcriptional regulator [Mycobacterium sp. DL99]|uniref:helix-turn-helix domain-containing protein n=1 Tax=Mycobacterium sp. DL99 TaxID=2528957 RepID=UPI0010811644|nr:helix-turn-helix transcriptional regulator [Mycobacterium sp. DL99]